MARVVAYLAGWMLSQPGIPAAQLTAVNVAFARIDARGEVSIDLPVQHALSRVTSLRSAQPQLQVLLSVGGWQAEGFSDAAVSSDSRLTFARSVVRSLRQFGLDGVDLDWEYPGQGIAGIRFRDSDKHNFTLLVQTLRAELDAESRAQHRPAGRPLLLSIAAADRDYLDHTEMDQVQASVDWINLMAYDFFNSLTATTGHHAGLYRTEHASPTDRNADSAVNQYLFVGVPAQKIVLGVAFYGRAFAGVKPQNNGIRQPYERFEGEHSYADLVAHYIDKQGFVRLWDNRAQAPYLWNSDTRIFITYEDPQSITVKTQYVIRHRLGGMMLWELSQDSQGALLSSITQGLH